MERRRGHLIAARDRLFLERACELAARAAGNTSPNPPVGAVVVENGEVVGEGYHHQAGKAHAEVEALCAAGARAAGATLYVSLEPCNHSGKTPPCTAAVIQAGISRVVIGTLDPNPRTARGGVAALQQAGIAVQVAEFAPARALIEPFAGAMRAPQRPFIALKMAASLDGFIAAHTGVQQWLTGEAARSAVRDLRIEHDAVMVGAGTVRIDDPQLTVRPAHTRLRPYRRVVVCETALVSEQAKVFASAENYAQTIVLVPGALPVPAALRAVAEIVSVGSGTQLDLASAMHQLRELGIQSVLCEGGPTLAGRLLARHLVDRIYWLVAPCVLDGPDAVPALNPPPGAAVPSIAVDGVERLGDDLLLTGTVQDV